LAKILHFDLTARIILKTFYILSPGGGDVNENREEGRN
jgi:hypothetical protein